MYEYLSILIHSIHTDTSILSTVYMTIPSANPMPDQPGPDSGAEPGPPGETHDDVAGHGGEKIHQIYMCIYIYI